MCRTVILDGTLLCGIVAHRAELAIFVSVRVLRDSTQGLCKTKTASICLGNCYGISAYNTPWNLFFFSPPSDEVPPQRSPWNACYAVRSFQGLVRCTMKLLSGHVPLGSATIPERVSHALSLPHEREGAAWGCCADADRRGHPWNVEP